MQWFVPPAVAPPLSVYCTDRNFLEKQSQLLDAPLESLAEYGLGNKTISREMSRGNEEGGESEVGVLEKDGNEDLYASAGPYIHPC